MNLLQELDSSRHTYLPGAVYAFPAETTPEEIAQIVTQNNDAGEMSITAEPMAEATSLSGLQAKLSLVRSGSRYVARTKDPDGIHIIAKLPSAQRALLPEVEDLSLRLAAAAGVTTCKAELAPLSALDVDAPFDVDETASCFLAVERFDRRDGKEHVHCENFAQVLNIAPAQKYQHPALSYASLAAALLGMPDGETQVAELVRRLSVNELLGNYDAHVKNFGIIYPDGRTEQLSPAYDVVAYSAYLNGRGHALRSAPGQKPEQRLSPAIIRVFCNACGFSETLRKTISVAVETWPEMIQSSKLLDGQKKRLLDFFEAVPLVVGLRKRMAAWPAASYILARKGTQPDEAAR
jgi:serine/threonine-protein kinase HipA